MNCYLKYYCHSTRHDCLLVVFFFGAVPAVTLIGGLFLFSFLTSNRSNDGQALTDRWPSIQGGL